MGVSFNPRPLVELYTPKSRGGKKKIPIGVYSGECKLYEVVQQVWYVLHFDDWPVESNISLCFVPIAERCDPQVFMTKHFPPFVSRSTCTMSFDEPPRHFQGEIRKIAIQFAYDKTRTRGAIYKLDVERTFGEIRDTGSIAFTLWIPL